MDLSCRNRNVDRPEYQYDMPVPPMDGVEFDDQHRPQPKARPGRGPDTP